MHRCEWISISCNEIKIKTGSILPHLPLIISFDLFMSYLLEKISICQKKKFPPNFKITIKISQWMKNVIWGL